MVVEGDRIRRPAPRAVSRRLPRGARRVDLGGLTLLPGLIDCHVHLLSQSDPSRRSTPSDSRDRYYRGIPWARRTLEARITTARDAGMTPAGMRDAIAEGLFPGPRLQVSVNIVSQTGGHGDATLGQRPRPARSPRRTCRAASPTARMRCARWSGR